jgi:hypothetical protein
VCGCRGVYGRLSTQVGWVGGGMAAMTGWVGEWVVVVWVGDWIGEWW